MDSSETPAVCSSPLRQLSPEKKQSLRSKIIRETPQRLYSDRPIFKQHNYDPNSVLVSGISAHSVNATITTANTTGFNNIPSNITTTIRNAYNNSNENNINTNCNRNDFFVNGNVKPDSIPSVSQIKENNTLNSQLPTSTTNEYRGFGPFESPILKNFINRSINKEFEFQKLIINFISLFIITLIIKFIKLFYKFYGERLQCSILDILIPFDENNNNNNVYNSNYCIESYNHNYGWNDCKSYLILLIKIIASTMNNIEKIKTFIHCIIIFNIIVSMVKLASYSRKIVNINNDNSIMDPHNNKINGISLRQRNLLGLDEDSNNNTLYEQDMISRKPHKVMMQNQIRDANSRTSTNNLEKSSSLNDITPQDNDQIGTTNNMRPKPIPQTPYLFKSLKTPLRRDQFEQQQQQQRQQQQHLFNGSNIFSSSTMNMASSNMNRYNLNRNSFINGPLNRLGDTTITTSTGINSINGVHNNHTNNNNNTIRNIGYIPSNKYAYMMNSPSPMKKR